MRGSSANVAVRWNESTDKWQFTNDGNTFVDFSSTADLSSHESDTTNVHGIANTALLATLNDLSNHESDITNVHGIANTALLVTTTDLSNHESDSTNIHGIANTALLVTFDDVQTLTNKTLTSPTISSPTITGVSPVITLGGDLTGNVTLSNLGNATLVANIAPNSVELGTDTAGNYMVNVAGGTGITVTHTPGEGSTATIALGATLDDLSDVTVPSPSTGQFLKYNGSAWVSDSIPTINALDDVGDVQITSGVANQILLYNGTNWINTSNPTIAGNLTVSGDLTISGTTTTVNTSTLSVADNVITLNSDVTTGAPSQDAGVEVLRGSSSTVSIQWNETDDFWQFTRDGSVYERIVGDVITSAQTAAYTLVLADRSKMVEMNVSSGHNLTVPTNSNVAFPTGTTITILQTGTGQTTVVGQSGVTVNATPGLKLRAQWSSATLIKRATDTWVLIGDISA